MNIILLSGGKGLRLWPISTNNKSKQFVKFLKSSNGDKENMLQRIYSQIIKAQPNSNIVISTNKTQIAQIKESIADNVNICAEPNRLNTFPAIALASSYMKDILNISVDETIIVCPTDSYVDDNFYVMLKQMNNLISKNFANICLMGIKPENASSKFGYIIPENSTCFPSKVLSFKEKSNKSQAKQYINCGGLWNCGVFAFKLGYMLKKAHKYIGFTNYNDLYNKYNQFKNLAFDKAIVEQEQDVAVLKYDGEWSDLGTWKSLINVMDTSSSKKIVKQNCDNVYIYNETNKPIVATGLKNVIISATKEGILVSDINESEHLNSYLTDATD